MPNHKMLNTMTYLIVQNAEINDLSKEIVDEYKSLNEKCDIVIDKIKNRKAKKSKKAV